MDDMQQLADTLAAFAVSDAQMGSQEGTVHSHLLGLMQRYGVTNPEAPALLDAAAAAVQKYTPYEEADPERAARYAHNLEMLGGTSVEDQLQAQLRAREWIESLAVIARASL